MRALISPEYSFTNELGETILSLVKIKLMLQKIFYSAICIYNQEKIKSYHENNKEYDRENAKQRYKEIIINSIRQIFSLIMISKFNWIK